MAERSSTINDFKRHVHIEKKVSSPILTIEDNKHTKVCSDSDRDTDSDSHKTGALDGYSNFSDLDTDKNITTVQNPAYENGLLIYPSLILSQTQTDHHVYPFQKRQEIVCHINLQLPCMA